LAKMCVVLLLEPITPASYKRTMGSCMEIFASMLGK